LTHTQGQSDAESHRNYVNTLEERFERDGFQSDSEVRIENHRLEVFAYKASLSLKEPNRVVNMLTWIEALTGEMAQDFVQKSFAVALGYKPLRHFVCLAFPIIVTSEPDSRVIDLVPRLTSKRFSLPNLSSDVVHPVLVDVSAKRIYHSERRPFWRGLTLRMAVDYTNKYLVF